MDQFENCSKVLLFLNEGISCYHVLQQIAMRYKKLQKIAMCTTFNVTQEVFFLKEGEKLLQHVTTSYNALQDITKTGQSKDQSGSCSKVICFLKEMISCYNVLQQVAMRYKKLQKIDMCTTFNITQGIYFLKEGEKLL